MKAIVTVMGKDMVGIIAKVSSKCAESNANVIEVSQSVLQDLFAMIMLVDISGLNCEFFKFAKSMSDTGEELGLVITAMHEDIFNSMHKI